jgi:rubrerythrin
MLVSLREMVMTEAHDFEEHYMQLFSRNPAFKVKGKYRIWVCKKCGYSTRYRMLDQLTCSEYRMQQALK